MLEHPWTELQVLIKEKWLTQKAFASILWKKVSEVNELLKWKRNITIQRDYLLHQTIWTPVKYRILKQVDYDYSLLDIEETQHQDVILSVSLPRIAGWKSTEHQTSHSERSEESSPLDKEGLGEISSNSEHSKESMDISTSFWTQLAPHSVVKIQENVQQVDSSAHKWASEWQVKTQETPVQEPENKDNEDYKKRARIFKSF